MTRNASYLWRDAFTCVIYTWNNSMCAGTNQKSPTYLQKITPCVTRQACRVTHHFFFCRYVGLLWLVPAHRWTWIRRLTCSSAITILRICRALSRRSIQSLACVSAVWILRICRALWRRCRTLLIGIYTYMSWMRILTCASAVTIWQICMAILRICRALLLRCRTLLIGIYTYMSWMPVLTCTLQSQICGHVWLFCGYVGLFCGNVGLFWLVSTHTWAGCEYWPVRLQSQFGGHIGYVDWHVRLQSQFCGYIGLFRGDVGRCICICE